MTLNQALFILHEKGLPNPSPISVFFLYTKVGDAYHPDHNFDIKFAELLGMQHSIQNGDSRVAPER
jgi:hypothetical protein